MAKKHTYHWVINSRGGTVKARTMKEAIGKAARSQFSKKPDKHDKKEFYVAIGKFIVRKGKFRWH